MALGLTINEGAEKKNRTDKSINSLICFKFFKVSLIASIFVYSPIKRY